MKLACILIPHFPLKSEIHRCPELKYQPVLIVRSRASQRTVADFYPELSGLRQGMPLQAALTVAEHAKLVEADDAHYASQYNEILDALTERSPFVEDGGLGCAYVGMDGLEELYGGDARLVLALQSAVPDYLNARVGVGNTKFASRLAALSAEAGRAFRAPEDNESFLESFPVDVLPVSFKTKARLRRFGLHTLGEVAALPLGSMQAQFGLEGKRMWELANGVDNSPLMPRKAEEIICEGLCFAEPVATPEAILLWAEVLLGRAFLRPEVKGRYTRLIGLEGQVYRRAIWTKEITFKAPVGEPHHAMPRIRAVLEGSVIPGPLEDLTVSLKSLTGESGRQSSLFAEARKHEQLQQALGQLDAVLGKQAPVYHVHEVEPWSRVPERRHALVPVAR